MAIEGNNLQPVFSHVEPVLSVQDVSATIKYWHEVMGFPAKWTWGDPPNHGGVSWQNIFVQFSLNPTHAIASKGSSIWIKVRNLEALYQMHQERKADIVAPLQNQPWGMADYTLRDINGHFLTFSGQIAHKEKTVTIPPAAVRIIGRKPTVKEYLHVATSVGWASNPDETRTEKVLEAVIYSAVAEDPATNQVIGCALLLGDQVSFYYVKDVMVHKAWQRRQVGTALMQDLTRWLENNAGNHALVGLFTGEGLEPFYQQFGFGPGFAMLRYINHFPNMGSD